MDSLVNEQDAAPLRLEAKIHPAQFAQRARDGVVPFGRSIKHQEAARARAQEFATCGASGPGFRVPIVNDVGRDALCEALLEQPAFVDDFAKRCDPVVLKLLAEFVRQFDHLARHVLLLLLSGQRGLLALEDDRGAAGDAGVEHECVRLQLLERLPPTDDGLDEHGVIRVELDEVQPAERRGVLVLSADGFAAAVDFDFAGFAGQLLRARVASRKGVQGVKQADDAVVCVNRYLPLFSFFLGEPVLVAGSRGELAFGSKELGARPDLFLDTSGLKALVTGPRRVFIVISSRRVKRLEERLGTPLFALERSAFTTLLSNRAAPWSRKAP